MSYTIHHFDALNDCCTVVTEWDEGPTQLCRRPPVIEEAYEGETCRYCAGHSHHAFSKIDAIKGETHEPYRTIPDKDRHAPHPQD